MTGRCLTCGELDGHGYKCPCQHQATTGETLRDLFYAVTDLVWAAGRDARGLLVRFGRYVRRYPIVIAVEIGSVGLGVLIGWAIAR